MRRNRGTRSGFTLIELLLVLVILAVLAAVVVPKFTGQSERARETRAGTDITTIEGALDRFEQDAGRYPTNDEGLDALVNRPGNVKDWNGPYIKMIPKDPWGNPYQYVFPGENNTADYDLSSLGADGQPGGTGNNADITNWEGVENEGH